MSDDIKKALEEGYNQNNYIKPCPFGYQKPCVKYPGYMMPCPYKSVFQCPYMENPTMSCPTDFKKPCDKYPGYSNPCPMMPIYKCPYKPQVSPYYPPMDKECLTKAVLESYYDELTDARYYEILADLAPTEYVKNILLSNMKDEIYHSQIYKEIYKDLTNMYPPAKPITLEVIPDEYTPKYVKYQFRGEIKGYESYLDYYLRTPECRAKEAFLDSMLDENKHAMLLKHLLC